jgi:hypothetical protein
MTRGTIRLQTMAPGDAETNKFNQANTQKSTNGAGENLNATQRSKWDGIVQKYKETGWSSSTLLLIYFTTKIQANYLIP